MKCINKFKSIMLFAIVAFLFSSFANSGEKFKKDNITKTQLSILEPDKIIKKVLNVYASCKTYRDNGTVKVIIPARDPKKKPREHFVSFETAFIRPDKFKFECNERDLDGKYDRCIVWKNGNEVNIWLTREPVLKLKESLSNALATATPESYGSAMNISSLLMLLRPYDDIHETIEMEGKLIRTGRWIEMSDQLKRLDDSILNKKDCFVIHGDFYPKKHELTIWIDKKEFTIVRIEQKNKLVTGTTVQAITSYNSEFNKKIDEGLFKSEIPE